MKTLRRVLSAAAALALLLCGCSSIDLARYPRVSDPPPEFPAQNLTLYLPADADEFLLDAMHQLADRVETLSGGSVSLTISDGSGAEDAELRVLTTANLIAADKRMQFLSFPYLFAYAIIGDDRRPLSARCQRKLNEVYRVLSCLIECSSRDTPIKIEYFFGNNSQLMCVTSVPIVPKFFLYPWSLEYIIINASVFRVILLFSILNIGVA